MRNRSHIFAVLLLALAFVAQTDFWNPRCATCGMERMKDSCHMSMVRERGCADAAADACAISSACCCSIAPRQATDAEVVEPSVASNPLKEPAALLAGHAPVIAPVRDAYAVCHIVQRQRENSPAPPLFVLKSSYLI